MIATKKFQLTNGISADWLGDEAARIHAAIAVGNADSANLNDAGWLAVAQDCIGLEFASDEARIDISVNDLAERYAKVWCDANHADFEDMIDRTKKSGGGLMIAWRWVARWLAFAVQTASLNDAAGECEWIIQRGQQEVLNDVGDSNTGKDQATPGTSPQGSPGVGGGGDFVVLTPAGDPRPAVGNVRHEAEAGGGCADDFPFD